MADLVVIAANLHNEKAAVDWLRARSRADARDHFHIGLVSEAHARRRSLRSLPGHTYLTGTEPGPSQETGILLDRRLPVHGHGYQRLSKALPKFESVGKERWGQDALTEVATTPLGLITLHPVAGPEALSGKNPDHALVQAYTDAMSWLDASITAHRQQGHEVIVGGDIQMWPNWDKPWSIGRVLARHQLQRHWHRIDLIAWSPGLAKTRESTHDIGSDHDALRVDLNINRTKRRTP